MFNKELRINEQKSKNAKFAIFLYQYLNTSWGLRSKASKRVHEDERLEYTISPLRVH